MCIGLRLFLSTLGRSPSATHCSSVLHSAIIYKKCSNIARLRPLRPTSSLPSTAIFPSLDNRLSSPRRHPYSFVDPSSSLYPSLAYHHHHATFAFVTILLLPSALSEMPTPIICALVPRLPLSRSCLPYSHLYKDNSASL